MKLILLPLLLLSSSLLYAVSPGTDTPTISVTGKAVISVPPELLEWSIELEHVGANLQETAQRHTQELSKVLATLKELGVQENDLQTSESVFNQHWDNRIDDYQGYETSTNIRFTIRDLTQYQTVWQTLATFDALSIEDTDWEITPEHRIRVREESRIAAIKAAKEKAAKLADALDMKILHPVKINEGHDNAWSGTYNANLSGNYVGTSGSGSTTSTYASGLIEVTTSIHVTFAMTQK